MEKTKKFLFILYFLFSADLFNIFNLNGTFLGKIINYTNHFAIFCIIILLCVVSLTYKSFQNYKRNFVTPILFFLLMIALVSLESYFVYGETSLSYMLKEVFNYLVVILYFPLGILLQEKKDWIFLIKVIVNVATAFSIVCIAQSFFFGTLHINLFFLNVPNLTLINSSTSMLLGFWRLNQAADLPFFASVMLLSFDAYFPSENILRSKFYLLFIFIFTIVFVSQTRGYYILVLLVFLVWIIFRHWNRLRAIEKLLALYFGIPLILIIGLFTSTNLISVGNRSQNLSVRAYEIQYYIQHWMYNRWFGIGIGTGPNLRYQSVLGGPQQVYDYITGKLVGGYSPTDVGLIGFFGIFGLTGIIFFVIFSFKLFRYLKINGLQRGTVIIFVVIFASLFTLSIFDEQRIIFLAFYLALFDCTQKDIFLNREIYLNNKL